MSNISSTKDKDKETTEKNNEDNLDKQLHNFNAEWSEQHEKILVEWADKAICYKWLHSRSHIKYSSRNAWFTIPVIIMSTLTGTANFALERIPENLQQWYSLGVGSVNILAGVITTIQQFLKIGELNEAHRASSISWDKFYRNIKLELAKAPKERIPAYQMLKISKEEFDRLMETSPSIDQHTINLFKSTFSGGYIKNSNALTLKQTNYKNLRKPEICDILETTANFVYKESDESLAKNKTKNIIAYAKETNDKKRKSLIINKFIDKFSREFKREPTNDEIYDNIIIDISNAHI
tara:strand:- start:1308 stop:2189 length:882 start_codon:yes stop_codon:yes gene_type:complete